MSALKEGDIVYSLDDLQAGYGEEATVIEVHQHDGRPDWAPSVTYTIQTKSGTVLSSMLRMELSTKKPTLPTYEILNVQADDHPVPGSPKLMIFTPNPVLPPPQASVEGGI